MVLSLYLEPCEERVLSESFNESITNRSEFFSFIIIFWGPLSYMWPAIGQNIMMWCMTEYLTNWAGLHVIAERHGKLWDMTDFIYPLESHPHWTNCPPLHMPFLQFRTLCCLIWLTESYLSFKTELKTFLLVPQCWERHLSPVFQLQSYLAGEEN